MSGQDSKRAPGLKKKVDVKMIAAIHTNQGPPLRLERKGTGAWGGGETPAVARAISAPCRCQFQSRKSLSGHGALRHPGVRLLAQNETLRELRRLLQHSCRVDGGSSRTSVSIHGLGYLLTALRRQGLIPDELVLQLATFLRSHDLFLELRVRSPRTLTANQARQGGKQGTDGRERSRIHFRCLASLRRSLRPKD
jgi:hypothetical protein